jgi:hypothetical protein
MATNTVDFAPVESGDPVSAEQEEAKLRLVGDPARRVWAG